MSLSYRRLLFVPVLLLAAGMLPERTAYAQPTGSPIGNQQLSAAQSNLAYAQANVNRLKDRALRSLDHDRAWSAAKTAVEDARKGREEARDQVSQRVMASSEYQALQRRTESAGPEDQKADARAKMATMVWEAQTQSPDCAAADARLKEAQADLDTRWKDYETRVLSQNPDWTSAVAARDAARAQVSAALQAQQARVGSRQSSRSSGSGRSGSSGSRSSRSSRSGY